jgi:Uma2 family endonuclease
MKEFEDKARDYFDAGVSRVWIVDPEAITIKVFVSAEESQVYSDNMPIVDTLFPGLELTVRQVFEEAELL